MARRSSSTELGLVALTIEGGLIAPEQVQKVIAADRTAKTADSYACPKGTSLGDEIARYFRIAQALWRDYDKAEAKTIARTAQFARDLMTQCLGFTDCAGPVDHREGTRRYRLAIEAKGGRVPVVVAAPVEQGDAFARSQPEFGDGEGGRLRRSPAALLQDWLNATDHALWGLVFAGDRVRLMRDNASLTRPAWIEADLCAMFRDEMFADFTAFWLLAHATRFGAQDAAPSDCALEQWREAGLKQGVEARKDLYCRFPLRSDPVRAPPDFMDKIYEAFGAIDLDPCGHELSPVIARQRILLSEGGDGLVEPWIGRLVYVNPPYSKLLVWLRRAHEQWLVGNAETVLCLVPVRTDSAWFHDVLSSSADIYFLRGRVRFLDIKGSGQQTPFSLMLVVLGAQLGQKVRLAEVVPGYWAVRVEG